MELALIAYISCTMAMMFISHEAFDGLRKVSLQGRYNYVEYVNFCESEEDMINKFRVFNCYVSGYFDYKAPEGSTLSYYFVGTKNKEEEK